MKEVLKITAGCVCKKWTLLLNNRLFITAQLAALPLKGEATIDSNDSRFNVRCQMKWATQLGADSSTDQHVINCSVINSLNSSWKLDDFNSTLNNHKGRRGSYNISVWFQMRGFHHWALINIQFILLIVFKPCRVVPSYAYLYFQCILTPGGSSADSVLLQDNIIAIIHCTAEALSQA